MFKRGIFKVLLAMVLVAITCSTSTIAKGSDKDRFLILDPSGIMLKNAENEFIKFKDPFYENDDYEGSMRVYALNDYDDGYAEETGQTELIVDKSKSFTFSRSDGNVMNKIFVEQFVDGKHTRYINAEQAMSVKFDDNRLFIEAEPGTTLDYSFGGYITALQREIWITGISKNDVSVVSTGQWIDLRGALGKIEVELLKKNKNEVVNKGIYYIYNNEVKVKINGNRIDITPSIRIPSKRAFPVTNLYLRPANNGKNMFLTWNKVKGAKSYIVYKYSPVKNEYVKVAIRNNYNANYYNIPNVQNNIGYKYKIVAKTKAKGKGEKACKESYPVWAVSAGNTKGNVTSITTNRKKVTGKAGKNIRLKAKVNAKGKRVLSKTIRWYSSNKKIVVVNKKTGKVEFKKKGKCYIWAKAHNGKNSKRIKINVK